MLLWYIHKDVRIKGAKLRPEAIERTRVQTRWPNIGLTGQSKWCTLRRGSEAPLYNLQGFVHVLLKINKTFNTGG